MFSEEAEFSLKTWEWVGNCARWFSYLGPLTTAVLGLAAFMYKGTGDAIKNSNRLALNSAGRRYAGASILIAVLTVAASVLKDKADGIAKAKASDEARAQMQEAFGADLDSFAREKLGKVATELSNSIGDSTGSLDDGITASKTYLSNGINIAVQRLNISVAESAADVTRREREDHRDAVTNGRQIRSVEFSVSTDGPVPSAPRRAVEYIPSLTNVGSLRGLAWTQEINEGCKGWSVNSELAKRCNDAKTELEAYENAAPFIRLLDPDESSGVSLRLYTRNMSLFMDAQNDCHILKDHLPRCFSLSDVLHHELELGGCTPWIGGLAGSRALCFREGAKRDKAPSEIDESHVAGEAIPLMLQISTDTRTKLNYFPHLLRVYEKIELQDGTEDYRTYVLRLSRFYRISGFTEFEYVRS